MPRHCPNCPYQTPDLLANVCPYCNTPLALSPHGRADRRVEPRQPAKRRWWPWALLALVLMLVAVPLIYIAAVHQEPDDFLGDVGPADSTGRIRVSMPARRLGEVIPLSPAEQERVTRRGFKGSVTCAHGRRLVRVAVWAGAVTGVQDADLLLPVPVWTRIEDDLE